MLTLLTFATSALALHSSPRANHHQRLARRAAAQQPTTLAPDSLSASQGCSEWYHVKQGQSCYDVVYAAGITLDDFYGLNPGVNDDSEDKCQNLWAGYDYCVQKGQSSDGAADVTLSTTKAARVQTTTSTSPAAQTSKAVAAAAASSSDEEDGEDGECDEDEDEDEVDDSSSSSSAPQTTTTTTTQAPKKTASSSSSSLGNSFKSSVQSLVAKTGISAFLNQPNTGAIASWYHTNSGQDSTNGHSWCGFPYNDQVPGFAPDVTMMLNNFGGDYEKAATAYCGLEAIVTTPDGKSATLYIADGFDHSWVRTTYSIDVIYGSFAKLFGSQTDNKNDVVQGVSWHLTGNRNSQYAFKGPGSG